jgi:DNA-binding transcriptional ArsR family regulator
MADAGAGGQATSPRIEWDSGTAYDFFASFWVLHQPEEFGLRASWAAGVRSRLSEDTRRFMGDVLHFTGVPVQWIHALPAPRDSRAAIRELERLESAAIPAAVVLGNYDDDPKAREMILRTVQNGSWSQAEADSLCCPDSSKAPVKKREAERERIERWLEAISRPAEFGKAFLRGMTEFRESFFREEERRIGPAVEQALANAQARARTLGAADLLEELTQGLRLGHLLNKPRLLLVPCYWCSPRIIYGGMDEECRVILFGARPPEASLVPEDQVPAALSLALTALSDTTRLNILRLLREEPLTQAEMARRLRLRPSTISHHLKSLRIAGLITYLESEGSDMRYETRVSRVQEVCQSIGAFLRL